MPGARDERYTLELLKNHGEFRATLTSLSMTSELTILDSRVFAVARRWFELGKMHYADGASLDPVTSPRSVYSRSYYAAYNASKAVRYVVRGFVSLRGDDQKKVADLPDSFPDVDAWSARLQLLYEHRLRADYDNWSDTASENQLSPMECLTAAAEFLSVCEQYLLSKYGVQI